MDKKEYKKAINELADSYELHLKQWAKRCIDTINEYTTNLQQENKQLKDNWNKLKECLKDVMNGSEADDKEFVETILDIIQEIEQGSDSNE